MAQVVCDRVGPGFRESERTVAVKDVYGRQQFLRVEYDFLTPGSDDKWYLPVGIVQVDRRTSAVLIELPHEADSGANRLWVMPQDFLEPLESPA